MEQVELDANEEVDAVILTYNKEAAAQRRRKILLGACTLIGLFLVANTAFYCISKALAT